MHEKAFKALNNDIIEVLNNRTESDKRGIWQTKLIFGEDIEFTIIDDTCDLFNKIINKILKTDNWGEKFSEEFIENSIRTILIKTIKSENPEKTSEVMLKELIEEIQSYDKEWIILIPLYGLNIEVDSFHLGNVKIFNLTEERKKEFLSKTKAKKLLVDEESKVFAELKILAEPIRARERAEEKVRRVLDILRFFIIFFISNYRKYNISLQGEVMPSSRTTPIISKDLGIINLNLQQIGPNMNLNINTSLIETMKTYGIFDLSDIFSKSENQLNDFEKTIIHSLHWYSSSMSTYETENKFLNIIICVETLLTPKDNTPIQSAIALGVAMILGKGPDDRKIIIKRMKELYKLRSLVSHGRTKKILDTDLEELKIFAGLLIRFMIKNKDKFQSRKELSEWIEDKILS